MSALPSIRTQNLTKMAQLSDKLEIMLHECDQLTEHSVLNDEIDKNFGYFNEGFERLKNVNITQVAEKPRRSRKIEAYVNQKLRSSDIPIKEIMSDSFRVTHLSFEGFDRNEVSRNITRQKRKFGEFWNNSQENLKKSTDLSQKFINPSLNNMPCKVSERVSRSKKLDSMIMSIMDKKLGLKNIMKPNVLQRQPKKKPRFIKNVVSKLNRILTKARQSLDMTETKAIDILAQEYAKYASNTSRQLELEKIIYSHHQKNYRRQNQNIFN